VLKLKQFNRKRSRTSNAVFRQLQETIKNKIQLLINKINRCIRNPIDIFNLILLMFSLQTNNIIVILNNYQIKVEKI